MKVHGLPANPMPLVEKRPNRQRAHIDVYSREEVMALVASRSLGAGRGDLHDGGLHRPPNGRAAGAAMARRRLRTHRQSTCAAASPAARRTRRSRAASGRCRWLTRSHRRSPASRGESIRRRGRPGLLRGAGGPPDAGHACASATRRAIEKAGLRELRFHDLRHTFGTHAIRTADSREVMEWMGHQDLKTTQIYLSYKPQRDAAERISLAFRGADPAAREDPVPGEPRTTA